LASITTASRAVPATALTGKQNQPWRREFLELVSLAGSLQAG
jgi:hypothetical protein